MENDVNSTCSINARKWTAIKTTWEQGHVVLVKQYKMAERFTRFATRKKIPQLLPKINARTGGIQVDERHLLFGEYLQKYAPLSPERAEK